MYLIMKCEELNDGWECDANRTPLAVVSDWKYFIKLNPLDSYEVYQIVGESLELIKRYDECLEDGMAFYRWEKDDNPEEVAPTVIQKYVGKTRYNPIPRLVEKEMKQAKASDENFDDSLENCGHITWTNNNGTYYVYGEFRDNHYSIGY